VIQRKVLTPNDFTDLAEVERRRLLAFQRRYQQTAVPFGWRFTRADLARLLHRLDQKPVEIGSRVGQVDQAVACS
jgi:hypothetical protein